MEEQEKETIEILHDMARNVDLYDVEQMLEFRALIFRSIEFELVTEDIKVSIALILLTRYDA